MEFFCSKKRTNKCIAKEYRIKAKMFMKMISENDILFIET